MSKKTTTSKKTQKSETVAETKPTEVKAVDAKPVEAVATPVVTEAKPVEKKVRAKKAKTPVAAAGAEEEVEGKRYFKCIYNNESQGRYCGDKPKQAANKAFTVIVRNFEGNCIGVPIKFQMVECTRGSARKTSNYTGVRSKLDVPLKIEIKKNTATPKVIEYKFSNKITKVKEQVGGKPEKKAKVVKRVVKKPAKKAQPKKTVAKPKKVVAKPKKEEAKKASN